MEFPESRGVRASALCSTASRTVPGAGSQAETVSGRVCLSQRAFSVKKAETWLVECSAKLTLKGYLVLYGIFTPIPIKAWKITIPYRLFTCTGRLLQQCLEEERLKCNYCSLAGVCCPETFSKLNSFFKLMAFRPRQRIENFQHMKQISAANSGNL